MRTALVASLALVTLLPARSAAAACVRPTDSGGFDGYDYGSAEVRSFGDANVLVWYTTSGPHAVNPVSSRADSVPDDVVEVARVTSDALASYASMGYRAPVSDATDPECGSNGGDGRLDVYLVQMTGADGMTVAEAGRCTASGAARRCASFVFASSNFAAYYTTSDVGIRTVLPHETFHAVQNAYDANIDRFWAEGTAQWAVKTLDPSLTDLERFLPAFFSATDRSLDAPANGVTSAFLYGAAIWPVFLTQRHGDDLVRSILEQEGKDGDSALAATAAVFATFATDASSSLAAEYALFSAWNAGTKTRAGSGGYTNAASYPMVRVAELEPEGVSGITSGFASYFYHAKVTSPATVTLDTDPTRNAGTLVPLMNGRAQEDEASPLPAVLDDEAIVVVSGITSKKTDAPFTVTLAPIVDVGTEAADAGSPAPAAAPTSSAGGCALASSKLGSRGAAVGLVPLGLVLVARRRGNARRGRGALLAVRS